MYCFTIKEGLDIYVPYAPQQLYTFPPFSVIFNAVEYPYPVFTNITAIVHHSSMMFHHVFLSVEDFKIKKNHSLS